MPGDTPVRTAGTGTGPERRVGGNDLREQRGSHLSLLITVVALALPVSAVATLTGLTLGELPAVLEADQCWIVMAIIALLGISSND